MRKNEGPALQGEAEPRLGAINGALRRAAERYVLRDPLMLLALFVLSWFMMARFTYSYEDAVPLIDSSIYTYMGRGVLRGLVPYRDMHDNKGHLLYFIEALGLWLGRGGNRGIYLLEVLSVSFSCFFAYRGVRRHAGRAGGMVAALILFHTITRVDSYEGGNFSEVYSLPFMMAACDIFLREFDEPAQTRFSGRSALLLGLTFAMTLNIRTNAAVMWLPPCACAFATLLFHKQIARAFRFVGFFALGAAAVIAPLMFYMLATDSLGDMMEAVFLSNFTYVGGRFEDAKLMISTFRGFFTQRPFCLCALAFSVAAPLLPDRYGLRSKWGRIGVSLTALSLLATILLPGRIYGHYFLMFMPVPMLALACLFRSLGAGLRWRHLGFAALLFVWFMPQNLGWIGNDLAAIRAGNYTKPAIAQKLNEEGGDGELQVMYLTDARMYLHTGRATGCRYFIVPALSYSRYPASGDAQLAYVRERRPQYVMTLEDADARILYTVMNYDRKMDESLREALNAYYTRIETEPTGQNERYYALYKRNEGAAPAAGANN